jgi:peroxiredoxin
VVLTLAIAAVSVSTLAEEEGKGKAQAAAAAKVGQPAPDFELKDLAGNVHKLSDLKDKIVVLEWWNQDCPVCRAAMPGMKDLSKQLAEKGVVWLAIDSTNYQTVENNKKYAEKEGIPYAILMDTDGTVGRAYGAKTTPHMFVVNKGTLAYAGAIDNGSASKKGDRSYVAEAVEEILAGKPVTLSETKPYGCSVKYSKPGRP